MVGYELLAETQRDLAPEDAAERLREVLPAEVVATDRVPTDPVPAEVAPPGA
jgi:hypothetical protein